MNNNPHSQIPATMKAMVLEIPGHPLVSKILPVPVPSAGQVLVKVMACGVCRTDLHIMDSELAHPKLPLIPGHEIVGTVVLTGSGVTTLKTGDVVGIPWVGIRSILIQVALAVLRKGEIHGAAVLVM